MLPIANAAAVLLIAAGPAPSSAQSSAPLADNVAVYCSIQTRRQSVLDAAEVLGLSTPRSGPEAFAEWRASQPADFARACTELIAAGSLDGTPTKPAASTPNSWTTLLGVCVGALLALLAGEWKSQRDRQIQRGQALRNAATAFRREGNAATRTLSQPLAATDTAAYMAARDELLSRLQEVLALRRTTLGLALADEVAGRKAEDVVANWPQGASARKQRADEAARWLRAVDEDAVALAASTQRPWPWRTKPSRAQVTAVNT